jgi:hypothetical protein
LDARPASDADGARALRRSLERLGVERLDLYQLHAVGKMYEPTRARRQAGAETLAAARRRLTRWLGITGTPRCPAHPPRGAPALRLRHGDVPLNFVLWADLRYREDAGALSRSAGGAASASHHQDRGQGSVGRRERTHTTWYEPFTDQATIDRAVAFVLTQPITTMCSVGDVGVLPRVLDAAARFHPLTREDQDALVATAGAYHSPFVGAWA